MYLFIKSIFYFNIKHYNIIIFLFSMSLIIDFSNIKIANPDNTYIVNEFIRYYDWIYSNYSQSPKSPKENYYKLLVIKKTIDIIAKFGKQIISGSQLAKIKGIGDKTIARINEIINTGKLSEIKQGHIPQIESVKELSSIYGIGPVKASEFYFKYKITNLKELIKAHKHGIIELTDQMKLGIKYKDKLVEKIPRILIARLDIFVHDKLQKIDKDFISVVCGSYRRGKPYSSDVDILITNKKLKSKEDTGKYLHLVLDNLKKYFIIDSLTTSYNTHFQGFASFKLIPNLPSDYDKKEFNVKSNVIRLDIIIVSIQFFYPALLHFTGSGDFNQKLRLHAKSLGYKLSEYGLIQTTETGKEVYLEAKSEQDIFDTLLLKYIPPEKR
jgi:DNA polymerase/3'-5' exonuclease PolX